MRRSRWTGRIISEDLIRQGGRYTRDVEVLWACLAGVAVAAVVLAAVVVVKIVFALR